MAGVGEGLAGLWHEAPVVAGWVQGEPQDPEGAAVADPAVAPDGPEAVVGLAAGADHELAELGQGAVLVLVVAQGQHHRRVQLAQQSGGGAHVAGVGGGDRWAAVG
jgi:hypothetical protein